MNKKLRNSLLLLIMICCTYCSCNQKHQGRKSDSYTQMKKNLQSIILRDKNNIIPSSDDSIKSVYNYFMENGEDSDKQKVNFYMASTYRDLNDNPRALNYFLKAQEIGESNDDIDAILQIKTYSQLAYIYCIQNNYREAMFIAEKECSIAKKAHCVTVWNIMDMVTPAFALNDTIKASKLDNITMKIIKNSHDYSKFSEIIAELLYNNTIWNKKDAADSCYNLIKQIKQQDRPHNYYTAIGAYYYKYVSKDSAANIYKEQMEKCHRLRSRHDAANGLMKYYAYKKQYKLSTKYALLLNDIKDSIEIEEAKDQTKNTYNEFRYQQNKRIQEKAHEEIEVARNRFVVCLFILVIFILVTTCLYYYRKKEIAEKLLNKDKAIKNAQFVIKKKDIELNDKKKELSELDEELSRTEENLELKMSQNKQLMKFAFMKKISSNASEIIDKFKKASEGQNNITEKEWQELFAAVDKLYPGFSAMVQNKIPKISNELLITAYLLKIGMTNPQIMRLTNFPHQTVWRRTKKVESLLCDELKFIP